MPGQNGKAKCILPNEEWQNITVEQINKGIVIIDDYVTYGGGTTTVYGEDTGDFNEFVWIPIPESTDFARVAWTEDVVLAASSTDGAFWEDTTTTEYTNMVSSINSNKGFYIGRYEASDDGNGIAQSKRNKDALELSKTEAITACDSDAISENMHLMYGIEWDSTLNWIEGNATVSSNVNGETIDLAENTETDTGYSWGHFAETTLGDARNDVEDYGYHFARPTGYSEYWKANNIYDFAGISTEITQENYTSAGSDKTVYRGGWHYCFDMANVYQRYPVYFRGVEDVEEPFQIGFRMSFYL